MTEPHTAPRLIVFTDLDGTLLRHEDYDWSPARDALAELARRRIPLVIASSKTRSEIEAWQSRLGIRDPFISENGGALFVRPGATPHPIPGSRPVAGYLRHKFGESYSRLRKGLGSLAVEIGVPLRGFRDMSLEEIQRLTGLSGDDLKRVKRREFDEPFVPDRPLSKEEEARLETAAAALGLRVTRGGRFHHLTGPSDKGRAARMLIACYDSAGSPVRSLGLGDGPNDLELLRVVDRPIVVARPDGTHDPGLRRDLPQAHFTTRAGPEGFNEAILSFLEHPW
jgi:mannosyl-3-phosphoglycerate phosphatase